jgi:hypothetical protein
MVAISVVLWGEDPLVVVRDAVLDGGDERHGTGARPLLEELVNCRGVPVRLPDRPVMFDPLDDSLTGFRGVEFVREVDVGFRESGFLSLGLCLLQGRRSRN